MEGTTLFAMAAEIFGVDGLVALAVALIGLVLVAVSVTRVVRSPGLTSGGKWGWGVAIVGGYLLYWLPGIVLAIVFLAMQGRWRAPRSYI